MARRKNNTTAGNAARSAAHGAPDPSPVPATGPAADDSAAAVLAALAAHPDGATTAVIAGAAGISRTVARDALTELETRGDSERTKGGRPGSPDIWHPAATAAGDGDATGSPATARTGDGPAAAEPAGQDGAEAAATPADGDREPGQDQPAHAGQPASLPAGDAPAAEDPDGPASQDTATTGPVRGATTEPAAAGGGGDGAEAAPDPAMKAEIEGHTGQICDAAAAVTTALAAGDLHAALSGVEEICEQASQARRTLKAAAGGKRAPAVKPGALRELAAAHLRAHPDQNFTPHQIGKVLGRSSGAVANALDRLVSLGEAELATEKPRSFRLAAAAAPAGNQPSTASARDEAHAGGTSDKAMAGAA